MKSQALAENQETQFQPVIDLSVTADIEIVDMALMSYFLNPASEPHLNTPDEVHGANRGLKVSKTPGPNGVPNRALKHLSKRSVSFLAHDFNADFRTHHFPQARKHAGIISILQLRKDPALPASYRSISLLDTTANYLKRSY